MKSYRTEIVFTVLISAILIGIVSFFIYRMESESEEGRVDLYDLVLSDPQGVIAVNRPAKFVALLERQPELSSYFKKLIPEDFFSILSHVQSASVLLVYYPQAIVAYYPLNNERDNIKQCFNTEPSLTVNEGDIVFDFYPSGSNKYFGCYEYNGVCVASSSRKLLKTIAGIHKGGNAGNPSSLKVYKDLLDKSALVNCLYPDSTAKEWQIIDLFMHEEQVCCLQYQPYRQESDSLILATADSLSLRIKELIPGLEVHPDFSKDDSTVYYTFCAPLQPKK